MSAQVIFINTGYYPDWYETQRLDNIQRELELYQAELAMLSRDFPEDKKRIYKESSHRNLRSRLHIVQPEK